MTRLKKDGYGPSRNFWTFTSEHVRRAGGSKLAQGSSRKERAPDSPEMRRKKQNPSLISHQSFRTALFLKNVFCSLLEAPPHHLRRSSVAPLITGQVGQFSIAHLGNFSKAPKLAELSPSRHKIGRSPLHEQSMASLFVANGGDGGACLRESHRQIRLVFVRLR